MEPIETEYKGYRFRSRLEARWAIFFDSLELRWEYEKEGYELPNGEAYLPDFWLPQVRMWGEVKGPEFSDNEIEKATLLTEGTGSLCLLLGGEPQNRCYAAAPPPEKPDAWDKEAWNGSTELYAAWSYCLTTIHGYPEDEGRLFACPGCQCFASRDDGCEWCEFPDVKEAVRDARSAQFEHGENGAGRV